MQDIEDLIYRIINGYYFLNIDNVTYKIKSPSIAIKQKAHNVYLSIINGYKFDDTNWLKKSDTDFILNNNNIWNNEQEEQLKLLNNRLDDMKVELYLKFIDPVTKKKLKSSIETAKNKISSMIGIKTSMDHLTLENYAISIKNEHIILYTVYDMGDNLIFDINNIDTAFFETLVLAINKASIGIETLRRVARHELWKSYWDSAKEKVFALPAFNWTDEQRLLVNLSKMYDAVKEHPECPDDEILEDDDALDGWMIFNKRKVEKERKKNKIMDTIGGKYKNANEIFIMTNSAEEAKEIYSLNDPESMAAIHHMKSLSNSTDKPIQWAELPHVKIDLQNKLKQRQTSNKGK